VANVPDDLLVAELRDLADRLDVPPPGDHRAAVRARLAEVPAANARRRRLRRWLAAAAAVVVGTVAAVPPARTAVADAVTGLFRFAGVEVREEPGPRGLPTTASPLPELRSAGLDEARRVARFPVRVPARLGVPEEVTVADPGPDGAPRVVTLVYSGGSVRLDQLDGPLDIGFVKQDPDAQWTQVPGAGVALWFPGPHAVTYRDRTGMDRVATARLAAPTLVWQVGDVTYRLEGVRSLDEAAAIAGSMR
jgi:hypothetical protein